LCLDPQPIGLAGDRAAVMACEGVVPLGRGGRNATD